MSDKKKKKAKFHTPQNTLRLKAGYGGLPPQAMERAEEYIQNNDVDFTGLAQAILDRLNRSVEAVKRDQHHSKEAINRIVGPIMEMKANGAMFKYELLTDVADIILNFLENSPSLDHDILDIVAVHQRTFQVIISKELKGDGGKQGDILIKELEDACARYYKRHGKSEG